MNKLFLVSSFTGEYEVPPQNICIVPSMEKFREICENLRQAFAEERPSFFIGDEEYIFDGRISESCYIHKKNGYALFWDCLDCVELSFIKD